MVKAADAAGHRFLVHGVKSHSVSGIFDITVHHMTFGDHSNHLAYIMSSLVSYRQVVPQFLWFDEVLLYELVQGKAGYLK